MTQDLLHELRKITWYAQFGLVPRYVIASARRVIKQVQRDNEKHSNGEQK